MLKGVFGFPKHVSDIVNQQLSFRLKLLMSRNKRKAEIMCALRKLQNLQFLPSPSTN